MNTPGYSFRGYKHRSAFTCPPAAPRGGPVPATFGHAPPLFNLAGATINWQVLWLIVKSELSRRGYALSTARVYHHILRAFVSFLKRHYRSIRPSRVTPEIMTRFIHSLPDAASWSWISLNISTLRTIFDKFGGLAVTETLLTPKRPHRLPEILNRTEAEQLIAAAPTLRDQLLIALMYRCGLKVGEACALKWQDVDIKRRAIRVQYRRGAKQRLVRIPDEFADLLALGIARCACDEYVFQGKRQETHLSTRMAEIIVGKTARQAGMEIPVTCMTLRHSGAVAALRAGMNIVEIQHMLGHDSIKTTLLYERFRLPLLKASLLAGMRLDLLTGETDRAPAADMQHADGHPHAGEPQPAQRELPAVAEPSRSTPNACGALAKAQAHNERRSFIQAAGQAPFPADKTSRARQFYSLLKLHLGNRFLTLRNSAQGRRHAGDPPCHTGPPSPRA